MTTQTKLTIIGWMGFIVFLILFFQRCSTGCTSGTTSHDTLYYPKYDSVPKEILVQVPGPYRIDTVPIPTVVDTQKILQSFFNVNYYSQTYSDSSMSGTILDTVSQNKITGKSFKYKWLKPVATTTIFNTTKVDTSIIIQPKRSLYVGGFVAANPKGIAVGAGVSASFITKKQTLYSIGYDPFQNRIELGAQIRLGKRQK